MDLFVTLWTAPWRPRDAVRCALTFTPGGGADVKYSTGGYWINGGETYVPVVSGTIYCPRDELVAGTWQRIVSARAHTACEQAERALALDAATA